MKIVDETLLDEVRGRACCWCSRGPSHAAHIFAKGHGGGLRLDHRLNVVPLCADCHARHHDGRQPQKADLIDAVARREKMTADAVLTELYRLQRADKKGEEPHGHQS